MKAAAHPAKPRILLSDPTAVELAPHLDAILGRSGYERVSVDQIHAGTSGADIAFVSRDVTGHSTKHTILPPTQRYYDALLKGGLKWVHVHSAGADRQVFLDLVERGVTLTTSSGASAGLVAQTALAGLLSLARRFPQLADAQRRHSWEPFFKTGLPPDLEGQTATIVGWGPIGQRLGAWLKAIGLNLIVVRQSDSALVDGAEVVSFANFRPILPRTDWLILACPLTPTTTNLLSAEAIPLMKPGSHLVNVARGTVVDEEALIAALRDRHLAGAYLDVFRHEPLAVDSPLWDIPNVIVTPHTAGFSDAILRRMAQMFLDNLGRWHRGEKLVNVVDKA